MSSWLTWLTQNWGRPGSGPSHRPTAGRWRYMDRSTGTRADTCTPLLDRPHSSPQQHGRIRGLLKGARTRAVTDCTPPILILTALDEVNRTHLDRDRDRPSLAGGALWPPAPALTTTRNLVVPSHFTSLHFTTPHTTHLIQTDGEPPLHSLLPGHHHKDHHHNHHNHQH